MAQGTKLIDAAAGSWIVFQVFEAIGCLEDCGNLEVVEVRAMAYRELGGCSSIHAPKQATRYR